MLKFEKKNRFNRNYKNILFSKDIITESFAKYSFDNTFCAFQSINSNIYYIIYSTYQKSIISYNLITVQKLIEIKNAHAKSISNFNHYIDKPNKRDLVMSISAEDNTIKIWTTDNFTCITNLSNINSSGFVLSSCFLYDNNTDNIFIITSNRNWGNNLIEKIKVYDLTGNKIKEINDSNHNTFFISSFFDEKFGQKFIITGNDLGNSISYNFNENKIYKKYNAKKDFFTRSVVVNDKQSVIKLIASCDGFVVIWNFNSGDLLKKIKVGLQYTCGICLLNKDYLFVGNYDRKIYIFDLNEGLVVDELTGSKHSVATVKKIMHPKYGECLLSQGIGFDHIRLIVFKR